MNKSNETSAPTFESVWTTLQELAESQKETDRMLKESARETENRIKETEKFLKESARETENRFKETEKFLKESARETDKRFKETERMIRENSKQIGGITASNGEFCEEYFINTFKENPIFLGEKFEVIECPKPRPMVVNDQYDLVLENGSIIVLIEMKYKAKVSDVKSMIFKLKSYRSNFPFHKDYKFYLCLASFRFRDYVKIRAAQEGIVLIQQRGDRIEVVSENVRTW